MKANREGVLMKLLVVALALAALLSQPRLTSGDNVSPSQCREERQNAVYNCKSVLFGLAPSAACYRIVKVGHVECGCPVVSPKLATLLTVNRVISVLKSCGRAIPHNLQCGSLYIP